MSQTDPNRLSVGDFVQRIRGEMIPISSRFSYFSTAVPLTEEDVREYLEEPIAALPPAVSLMIPKVAILLVPYLERPNGKEQTVRHAGDLVCFEKPADTRVCWSSSVAGDGEEVLAFALKDQEVVDYHYRFFGEMSRLADESIGPDELNSWFTLLREELNAGVHGEVDERSWRLKQAMQRRQTKVRRETKVFREYAHQSLVDTLVLYLHGICCDIDVETGPRQLPSRNLRRRLQLLQSMYPPPQGYAVFPEDVNPDPRS